MRRVKAYQLKKELDKSVGHSQQNVKTAVALPTPAYSHI